MVARPKTTTTTNPISTARPSIYEGGKFYPASYKGVWRDLMISKGGK